MDHHLSYQWTINVILLMDNHYPINGSSTLSYQWIIIIILPVDHHYLINDHQYYPTNESMLSYGKFSVASSSSSYRLSSIISSYHVVALSYWWIIIVLPMDYHHLTNKESSSLFSFSITSSRESSTYHINLFLITSYKKKSTLKNHMENMRYKHYLLNVKLKETDVWFLRSAIKCQHSKRHFLPFELYFYANEFYLNLRQEHSKGWILQKQSRMCRWHKKGCNTTWKFFLVANWT